jgi:hypothetical protein
MKLAEDPKTHLEPKEPIKKLYIEYDGTGTPIQKKELEGVKGKQEDGSAKTREVKIGCVFTQTTLDKEGKPVRDPNSTTFLLTSDLRMSSDHSYIQRLLSVELIMQRRS